MREAAIYFESANWRTSGAGPFRIHAKRLAYDAITSGDKPLLTCGYVPRHVEADGLEPGDLTKFLAIPWHTDYNSCATHLPNPNPKGNKTLFWSWPAQRPVAVYALADVKPGGKPGDPPQLGQQRWSVRGEGTDSTKPENWGRYQRPNNIHDILDHWHRIGIVVQAPAIVIDTTLSLHLDVDWYLEVESQLSDTGKTPVVPYPNFDSGG